MNSEMQSRWVSNQGHYSDHVERVLQYIKSSLDCGTLRPGDRLPAERRLAEQLGVSRAHVRMALQKLEIYGIVRTYPQSGTVVAEEPLQVLERLITDALHIGSYDFASLVEVRVMLECEAVRRCAANRTDEDLVAIEEAMLRCEEAFDSEERMPCDFAFHQAVARGSRNNVLSSLLLVITPDVLHYYQRCRIHMVPREVVCEEHRQLVDFIREKDAEGAVAVLRRHLKAQIEFSQNCGTEAV